MSRRVWTTSEPGTTGQTSDALPPSTPSTWRENLVDPQRWNRYAYARNNTLRYKDPDGRVIETIADIGFIAYDLFDIGRSVFRGEGVSGSQLGALGADVLGAAIPFATGGGIAVRAASKIDDAVDLAKGADHVGTEIVQRAMSLAEAEATQATGLVRGGREGTHYVSDAVNSSAQRARQRLALPQTPKVRATMEVPTGRFSPPRRWLRTSGCRGEELNERQQVQCRRKCSGLMS